MLRYEIFDTECLKDRKKAQKRLQAKYGIQLSKDFILNKYLILLSYVGNQIEKGNYEEKLDRYVRDYGDSHPYSKIVQGIKQIVKKPENYEKDMICCIYLGLINFYGADDFKRCDRKIKEDIQSVWERKSNLNVKSGTEKVNKESVRKHYPTTIEEETNDHTIKNITGGCVPFHHTMISVDNISMFDLDTEITSLKRYSYMRSYQIYEKIQDKAIENILLAELSLGLGYTSQLYSCLKEIEKYSVMKDILESIKPSAQIEQFFIRKEVIDVIWNNLDISLYYDIDNKDEEAKKEFNEVCKWLHTIMECVQEIISDVFEEIIDSWWDIYVATINEEELYQMSLYLTSCWKRYYDDEEVYADHIKHYRIHNWRNISKEEDCFYVIPDFTVNENDSEEVIRKKYERKRVEDVDFVYWPYVKPMELGGRVLFVEDASNDIGGEILYIVEKDLSKKSLPDNSYELYSMFYKERQAVYKKIRMEERNFLNGDVKISKSLKCIHKYSIIHYEVMKILLQ